MAATLTPTSNYVDVGANIGDMLVHALAYAPEGRHIAVEPLPELCDELRRRHRTVDVHNLALSNAQGETEFTRVCDAEALSGFLRPDLGTSFKTERLIITCGRRDSTTCCRQATSPTS
jgi:FkbM family methyltransferase